MKTNYEQDYRASIARLAEVTSRLNNPYRFNGVMSLAGVRAIAPAEELELAGYSIVTRYRNVFRPLLAEQVLVTTMARLERRYGIALCPEYPFESALGSGLVRLVPANPRSGIEEWIERVWR